MPRDHHRQELLATSLLRARARGAARARQQVAARALARRQFLRAAGLTGLGLGSAAALAACGGDEATAGSTASGSADYGDLAVQLSWIKNVEFVGEYMADDRGYYEEAGFSSVDLLAGGAAGTSAESAVASGRAFAGLSAPSLTAPAIAEGAELRIVGATFQKNPFCILSLGDNPIPTPQDMVGKRIGVQSGGNDTIFNALLQANDLDPASMTIVPVQFDPTILTTGDVDGFMSYITNEPIILATEGFEVATFLFAEQGFPLTAETFCVSAAAVEDERDKVKAFLTAELRGWIDALNEPEEAVRLAVEEYGADLDLNAEAEAKGAAAQAQLIVSDDTRTNGLFTMTDALVEENIASLALGGIDIAAEDLFDLSIIDEIHEENPDLASSVTL